MLNEAQRQKKRETSKRWQKANPEKARSASKSWRDRNPNKLRDYKFKVRYGISIAEYEAMLAQQNGTCAICHEPPADGQRLDHHHDTGKVRSLLCVRCNTMIGMNRERPEILRSAVAYLARHE